MAEDIVLGNKSYVSSKKAAQACGYAQDYVGQLARSGVIDAQRVGGLWYVSMESLEAYKRNTEAFQPQPPTAKASRDLDTIINFDGKDYISASRASKLTGYNQDYVGQLARAGKVLSRQVGNRWYVERDGLLAHKTQKDALLANVQAEAVGLVIPAPVATPVEGRPEPVAAPFYTYHSEDRALLPTLVKPQVQKPSDVPVAETRERTAIPIRVVQERPMKAVHDMEELPTKRTQRISGTSMRTATKAVAALTVVIVVSYGFVSIRSESIYALAPKLRLPTTEASMLGSAQVGFERLLLAIESFVSEELHYSR